MSRYKDFDAARAERAGEPLTFKLGGEMFTGSGEIPAGLLLDASAALTNEAAAAQAFQALFEGIVPEEDHERFATAVRRVDMQTVFELVTWIMEEISGRPFGNASSSPKLHAVDGAPSKDGSVSWVAGAHST
jgi:hypothetical protein